MADTNPRKIYVGNLPKDYTEIELRQNFTKFGQIRRIEFKGRSDDFAKFGFVEYDTPAAATDAVSQMNGIIIGGDRIQVKPYCYVAQKSRNSGYHRGGHYADSYRSIPKTAFRVTVHGLSDTTNWQDLKDFGRKVGIVNFADVHRESDGQLRGILEFQDIPSMESAIERLSGTELLGSIVHLTREKRSPSPSRHRVPSTEAAMSSSKGAAADLRIASKSRHSSSHHDEAPYSRGGYNSPYWRQGPHGHESYSRASGGRRHRSRSPVYYSQRYASPPPYHRMSPVRAPMRMTKISLSPVGGRSCPPVNSHYPSSTSSQRGSGADNYNRGSYYSPHSLRYKPSFVEPDIPYRDRGGSPPMHYSPRHGKYHHHQHHHGYQSGPHAVSGAGSGSHKSGGRPRSTDRYSPDRPSSKTISSSYYQRRY